MALWHGMAPSRIYRYYVLMGISSVKTLEASAHSDHSTSAVNIHERPTARDNPNPSVANRWKCPAPQRPVEFFEVPSSRGPPKSHS